MPIFSPGEAEDVAEDEKPPNEDVMLVPLVRPPRPLKPPPFPKPENAVVPPLAAVVVKENPLKPLKAPGLSPCNKDIHFPD